jgi:hypothetical protein
MLREGNHGNNGSGCTGLIGTSTASSRGSGESSREPLDIFACWGSAAAELLAPTQRRGNGASMRRQSERRRSGARQGGRQPGMPDAHAWQSRQQEASCRCHCMALKDGGITLSAHAFVTSCSLVLTPTHPHHPPTPPHPFLRRLLTRRAPLLGLPRRPSWTLCTCARWRQTRSTMPRWAAACSQFAACRGMRSTEWLVGVVGGGEGLLNRVVDICRRTSVPGVGH